MMRRSPPPVPASTPGAPQQTYDSDTPSERSGSSNVAVRHKRRRELDDDHRQLKAELTSLFTSLSATVDQHFTELKQQNAELKASLQFMSDKYDSVLKSLANLEEDRAQDKKHILKLEEKIELMERKVKSTGLEIRNVPAILHGNTKVETKEDVSKIVMSLAKAVEVELHDSDIKDTYRIMTNKENIKPIIVELNSVLKRDKILQGVRNLNKAKTHENKLNTGHLKIAGPIRPVYISEALTSKAQKIYYLTRQFARENNYAYCWTSRGLVYLRKTEGELPHRIENESDLTKLAIKI